MTDPERDAFVERFAELSWVMSRQLNVAALAAECVELAAAEMHRLQYLAYVEAHKAGHPDCPTCRWIEIPITIPWAAALPSKKEEA
jgi:hypothetical protein